MPISFFYEETGFRLRKVRSVRSWIELAIKDQKKEYESISYIFCSDPYLLDLNQKYLQHDTYTDIITFDYSEGNTISGDIFISIDRVRSNARKYSKTVEDELHRVIIHGILHLCGFKDKTPEEQVLMRASEDFYLSLRNF